MYIRNMQPIPCKSSLYTTAKTTVFLALTHKPTHISGTARVLAAVRQRVNSTRHVLHHHSCPWPFLPARRTPTRVDRVSGTKSHQDDSPSRRPSRSAHRDRHTTWYNFYSVYRHKFELQGRARTPFWSKNGGASSKALPS